MSRKPNLMDDRPFLMTIEDIFVIKGRGVVVAGRIQQGVAQKGDAVEIGDQGRFLTSATMIALEQFRKPVNRAKAGEHVGIRLRGDNIDQIKPGMVIAAPGTLAQES